MFKGPSNHCLIPEMISMDLHMYLSEPYKYFLFEFKISAKKNLLKIEEKCNFEGPFSNP